MGETVNVSDGHSRMVTWLAVVVFAYSYKLVLVELLPDALGYNGVSRTLIRGIDVNHWIEIIIYYPLVWLALHEVNENLFGVDRSHRRLIGEFAIAMWVYGSGVHIANVLELYLREQRGIHQGEVYKLVYFFDEDFSHYLQLLPLFFLFGWFVINDRARIGVYPTIAILLGVGHGVERSFGTIEAGKWFLGVPLMVWLSFAAWARKRRLSQLAIDARDDFFFRYALSFAITLPVAQLAYFGQFGSFRQPSNLGNSDDHLMAVGVVVLTLMGTGVLVASERWWNPHRRAARTGVGQVGRAAVH